MKRLERRHSLFKKLCTQLIRTTNLFQVDLFSPCVAPASRSIVPYLPERRVQGRVNISDTLSSELCSEMYRNPGRIDYPTGRVAIFLLLPFAPVLVCVKCSCIGSQVQDSTPYKISLLFRTGTTVSGNYIDRRKHI